MSEKQKSEAFSRRRVFSLLGLGAALSFAPTLLEAKRREPLQGQDRSGSQCKKTNGEAVSGSCGTVCKDRPIKTATGEDQASGYQYTCTKARTVGPGGGRPGGGGIKQP
jgi:hypothetical protein